MLFYIFFFLFVIINEQGEYASIGHPTTKNLVDSI